MAKNKLTEEDIQNLVATKIKEPGLSIDDIYISISHIHPKPTRSLYCIIFLWFASVVVMVFSSALAWITISLTVYILTSIITFCIESKHSIINIPGYLLILVSVFILVILCHANSEILNSEIVKEIGVKIIDVLT